MNAEQFLSVDRPAAITAAHVLKFAIIYVRQSSLDQVREHSGSTSAQRDLRHFALRWGWPESRVRVIDCDLGLSGTSTSKRAGFHQMLHLMDAGAVGIVIVQDVSRLSRDVIDFQIFLRTARETGTLICSNGVVCDPASDDVVASLGLEVQALFGAVDNRQRTQRLMAAKTARARNGEAVSPPPIGYVKSVRGQWVKDPDRRVQEAILRVFDLYPQFGSLGKIVNHFRANGWEFPRRVKGNVKWGPVDPATLHRVFHNPAYAGTYAFLRHPSRKRQSNGGVVVKRRSPSDWIVKDDHHEPYVPREVWQQIQDMLAARRPTLRPIVGKGSALLQGLLRCGQCGKRMGPQYWSRAGMVRTPKYVCLRVDGWGDNTHRVTVPARLMDHAVGHHVLEALTAVDREAARTVLERSQLERAALERERRRRLEYADEDVERWLRQLLDLSPEHRHAKADLQARYEASLRRREDVKAELAAETVPSISLTPNHVDELVQRTSRVRQLWMAPERTNEDRKRLLQTVVAEIVVHRANREEADLEIVWKGGLREPLRVLRSRGVTAFVREQSRAGKSIPVITEELNALGVVTATGRPLSANVVVQKQGEEGLRLKDERRRARELVRQGLLENLPRPEILRQLQDQAPRLGPWDSRRLSEIVRLLRRRVPEVEALPAVLPAEEAKQRVLTLVDEGLAAGKDWKMIAVALNETGLRPPRGTAFTPVQIRLLYLRAHGLRSFKLPSNGANVQGSRL
ncbi:MAG: hypothetical protein DMD89_06540 [Candidatus Rokuibacteriota bacterium]|nr:MAG: hypothetical protein DMD89_06540 [Candidatus Rokubacteria bacterium]